MSRLALAALSLSLLPACIFEKSPTIGIVSSEVDSADDPPEGSCDDRTFDVGFSEVTDLGFSAEQAIALIAGPREAELVYADGSTTTITVSAAHDGGAVQYTARESLDTAWPCQDTVRIGVTLSYSTADGVFAETAADALVLAEISTGINLHPRVQATDLGGSYSRLYTDYVEFVTFISADAFTGEIIAVDEANGEEDSDNECGVAAWGAPLMTGCG